WLVGKKIVIYPIDLPGLTGTKAHWELLLSVNDKLNGKEGTFSSINSTITVARDPNIKYGPEGNVLSGQKLDYKVEYENEGEGIAYGVYFTDTLDEDLNDSTLEIGPVFDVETEVQIGDPGIYNPNTRTITWFTGEVGPGQGGYAEFSVNTRSDAPDGTEIINFATVYFPSVPEATRTNGVVSIVRLNQSPIADAGGPYEGNEGSPINFDGSNSTDPDGNIVLYEWDLDGDGQYDDATGVNPQYTWNDDYSGNIGLNVTDNDGLTDTDSTTVTIVRVKPIPATIRIEPETLNLASKGVFTAFIALPESYDVANIDVSTAVCEVATAVKGMISEVDKGTYIAKFNREDLVNVPTGDAVTLRVIGKVFYNSGLADFEGSDTIRVINQGNGKK
ncbi:MAG: PKD domain-containing protein, partial [bacterium]